MVPSILVCVVSHSRLAAAPRLDAHAYGVGGAHSSGKTPVGVQASGTIVLPALALWLIDAPFGGFHVGFVVVIALAAIGASASAIFLRQLPKKIHNPHAATLGHWWQEILNVLDREIILASALSFGPSHHTSPRWPVSWFCTRGRSASTTSDGFLSEAARDGPRL
jgi:hypothetical protein